MIRIFCLFIGLTVLFINCVNRDSNREHNGDQFYQNSRDYDLKRIPLIKPYFAASTTTDFWLIAYVDSLGLSKSITDVKDLNVCDGKIFVYSKGEANIDGQKVSEAWFVMWPDRNTVIGFQTEKLYLSYLKKYNIPAPVLLNISEVFNGFDQNYYLPW